MDNRPRLRLSRRTLLAGTAAAGVALLSACGEDKPNAPGPKGPLQPFKFSLGFLPLGRYAPYYYARELGFYAERGLDVTLESSSGTGASMTQLLAGNVNATQAPMSALLQAMSKSPSPLVKGYANFWTRDISSIFYFKGKGVSSPKDLEGKTLTTSAGSNEFVKFPAFAKATGIDASKVKWNTVDAAVKVSLLLRHETEFTTTTLYGLAQLEAQKKDTEEIGYFTYGELGVGGVDGTVLMSADWVAANTDKAKGFIAATIKGMQEAFKNPQAAVDAMAKDVKTLDKKIALREVSLLENIAQGPVQKEKGLGFIDETQVKHNYDFVVNDLGNKLSKPVTEFFSNDLLPGR